MKYILDFDGVILDIDALKTKMEELEIPLSSRSIETLEYIKVKDASFAMTDLVFSDALAFIQENAKNCIIVSSYVSVTIPTPQDDHTSYAYQLEKILQSGVKDLGVEDIRVVGKEKKEALRDIQQQCGEDCLFVDDRVQYIQEAEEIGMKAFFMNRKKIPHPEYVVTNEISSFAELHMQLR